MNSANEFQVGDLIIYNDIVGIIDIFDSLYNKSIKIRFLSAKNANDFYELFASAIQVYLYSSADKNLVCKTTDLFALIDNKQLIHQGCL